MEPNVRNIPAQPIPPPNPNPHSSLLPTIFIGILMLLLGLGLGYLLFANKAQTTQVSPTTVQQTSPTRVPLPTINPTAGWKTYTNTLYKYTLKYPTDWNITVAGNSDPNTFIFPFINSPCNYDAGDLCLQVGIQASISNGNLEPNFIVSSNDKITNKTTTALDGENDSAFEYFQANYGYPNTGRLQYVVVVNHGSSKFTITYEESQKGKTFSSSIDWKNKKLFDQILSTFKFTQ